MLLDTQAADFLFSCGATRVYAVLASDGIWEFIDYAKAVDLTSKKLGPKRTQDGDLAWRQLKPRLLLRLRLKGPREAGLHLDADF